MNSHEADPAKSTTIQKKRDETDIYSEHSSPGQVNDTKNIIGSAATAESSTNTRSGEKPTAHGNVSPIAGIVVQAIGLIVAQVTNKRRYHLEKSHLSQTRNQCLPQIQMANAYVEDACIKR